MLRWATADDPPDIILIDPVKGDYRALVEAAGRADRPPVDPTRRW